MIKEVNIRRECQNDVQAIRNVIEKAFQDQEYSQLNEHLLVDELRKSRALALSLVAEIDGKIVGHIAFSVVTVNDVNHHWYGLAPVSVRPDFQRQGIGSKLIEKGLEQIKAKGANGCVLVGEPGYYSRFGFTHPNKLIFEGVPDRYFMAQSFTPATPSGKVKYHKIFSKYS